MQTGLSVRCDAPAGVIIDKRQDYASAGVSEYWIIDPRDDSITLLQLSEGDYKVLARQTEGSMDSQLLPGLRVDVQQLFAQARKP